MTTQSQTLTHLSTAESSGVVRRALHALTATVPSAGPTIARLALAVVIFPHGAQKVFGWFGGHGFEGTMGFFTQSMGIPAPLAFLAILTESLGAVALALGVLARPAALAIAVNMVVAAVLSHLPYGFFMNWSGTAKGEGFEFHILAVALAAIVVIWGGGRWSIDRRLASTLAER